MIDIKEELIKEIKELLKTDENEIIDINPNYLNYFDEDELKDINRKIYDLAKSGIRDFDHIENQLVAAGNVFAQRADPYVGDFELIEAQEQGHE